MKPSRTIKRTRIDNPPPSIYYDCSLISALLAVPSPKYKKSSKAPRRGFSCLTRYRTRGYNIIATRSVSKYLRPWQGMRLQGSYAQIREKHGPATVFFFLLRKSRQQDSYKPKSTGAAFDRSPSEDPRDRQKMRVSILTPVFFSYRSRYLSKLIRAVSSLNPIAIPICTQLNPCSSLIESSSRVN